MTKEFGAKFVYDKSLIINLTEERMNDSSAELLAEWVFKMYSAEGLNKKQRMKLGSLYRLIKNVIGGCILFYFFIDRFELSSYYISVKNYISLKLI